MDGRKEERRKVWNTFPHREWLNCYLLPVCGRRNKGGDIYITGKLKPCYHSGPCTNLSRAFIPRHPALGDLLFSNNAIGSFTFSPYNCICCDSILSLVQNILSFVIIHYHSKNQRKIKFAPRIKLNHDIYKYEGNTTYNDFTIPINITTNMILNG